jgi:hypothetical protein
MTAKTQAQSRIMGAVHETARDLHAAGFIDTRRMRAYDALCLAPVPDYSKKRIRALRQRHKPSRAVLAVLKAEAENQRAMVARLRTLRPTGRVVLELPEEASSKDLPDLELEDGDRLMVPSRPSMVSVFGAVYNEKAFLYRPEKRVADYLNQAGGATRTADTGSIYVLRADGSVISKRESGLFWNSLDRARLMPGDAIVVPEDFDRTTLTRNLKDWPQILYQFGLGAAAIKVLRQ